MRRVPRAAAELRLQRSKYFDPSTGSGYAITAMLTSPDQLTLTAECNGTSFTQPWIPGAALNTGAPGAWLGGGGHYADGIAIQGRYESTGTARTYTWNLKGTG